ncbi:MAG: hypothetical protein MZV70_52305 [Desulfobacterales bacterium]|nr:hypothetical protein [Desulfobacterales bacterium]
MNGYVLLAAHVERLPDGSMVDALLRGLRETPESATHGPAKDRVHWRKAEINPVFKNGSGPFLERCYTPSLVQDADGSLLLYRAAKDATAYRTFVSRLRAPALGWRDLLGPDRLGQGLTAREAVRRAHRHPGRARRSHPRPVHGRRKVSSTPTSRAAASGRNTPGRSGSRPDFRNTSLFFGCREIP